MKEQMILEDILREIGRTNNISNFPAKLPFEEANIRLVNYNKLSKQKEEKVGVLLLRLTAHESLAQIRRTATKNDFHYLLIKKKNFRRL